MKKKTQIQAQKRYPYERQKRHKYLEISDLLGNRSLHFCRHHCAVAPIGPFAICDDMCIRDDLAVKALKLINNRIVNGVYPIGCYSLMVHSHDRCVCGGIRDDLSSEWQSIGCGHSHARTKVADRVGTRLTLGFACVLRNSGCTLVSGGHRDRDHENITFVGDRMWGCFVQTGSNTAAITAMTVPRITANDRNQA